MNDKLNELFSDCDIIEDEKSVVVCGVCTEEKADEAKKSKSVDYKIYEIAKDVESHAFARLTSNIVKSCVLKSVRLSDEKLTSKDISNRRKSKKLNTAEIKLQISLTESWNEFLIILVGSIINKCNENHIEFYDVMTKNAIASSGVQIYKEQPLHLDYDASHNSVYKLGMSDYLLEIDSEDYESIYYSIDRCLSTLNINSYNTIVEVEDKESYRLRVERLLRIENSPTVAMSLNDIKAHGVGNNILLKQVSVYDEPVECDDLAIGIAKVLTFLYVSSDDKECIDNAFEKNTVEGCVGVTTDSTEYLLKLKMIQLLPSRYFMFYNENNSQMIDYLSKVCESVGFDLSEIKIYYKELED